MFSTLRYATPHATAAADAIDTLLMLLRHILRYIHADYYIDFFFCHISHAAASHYAIALLMHAGIHATPHYATMPPHTPLLRYADVVIGYWYIHCYGHYHAAFELCAMPCYTLTPVATPLPRYYATILMLPYAEGRLLFSFALPPLHIIHTMLLPLRYCHTLRYIIDAIIIISIHAATYRRRLLLIFMRYAAYAFFHIIELHTLLYITLRYYYTFITVTASHISHHYWLPVTDAFTHITSSLPPLRHFTSQEPLRQLRHIASHAIGHCFIDTWYLLRYYCHIRYWYMLLLWHYCLHYAITPPAFTLAFSFFFCRRLRDISITVRHTLLLAPCHALLLLLRARYYYVLRLCCLQRLCQRRLLLICHTVALRCMITLDDILALSLLFDIDAYAIITLAGMIWYATLAMPCRHWCAPFSPCWCRLRCCHCHIRHWLLRYAIQLRHDMLRHYAAAIYIFNEGIFPLAPLISQMPSHYADDYIDADTVSRLQHTTAWRRRIASSTEYDIYCYVIYVT